MALFIGQDCPLCGVKMMDEDRLFATSHFLGPESDLWRFSDAVMHWDCYAKWEHQARFGRMYFEARREWTGRNPYWGVALSDDQVFVTSQSDRLFGEVDVMLAEDQGRCFRIRLSDSQGWLVGHGPWTVSTRSSASPWRPSCRCAARLPGADSVIASASRNS